MTSDKAMELLKKHASELGEHFDAVEILATWREGEATLANHFGQGNHYARMGLAREMLDDEDARRIGQRVASALPY